MKTIYDLKPAFQNLLRPLSNRLVRSGVSPNAVTLAALLLSMLAGGVILGVPASWPFFLLPVVLFVRMALNALDGMMAREHNLKTALGAVLNELGDVLSDVALYLPLACKPGIPGATAVLVVLLAVLSEMSGVVGVQIGASRRYDGPMGKSDRAFVFGVLGFVLGFGVPGGDWLRIVFAGVVVLLLLTIWNRVRNALKEVRK